VRRALRPTLLIVTALALFSWTAAVSLADGATEPGARRHGFSVKEYKQFHDVLHPLEHEALPKNDFKTIRAKAAELVSLGEAILKLGVPAGTDEKYLGEFKEGLKRFGEALSEFKDDAESGTDAELKESYSAVHDSFETLASMLPRK